MAIIGTQDDEDKKNVIAQPTTSASPNAHAAYDAASGAPYTGAGGGAGLVGGAGTGSGQGVSTGAVNAPATGAASPNPGGGGYTNLSQYLAVNQGSGATTGQAAGNVVQQATDAATGAQGAYNTAATNDINTATSAVGVDQANLNKVNAGAQNADQGTLDKISGAGYTYNSPAGLTLAGIQTDSADDLNKMVQAGADASKWSYGGPTDFSKVQYGGPSIADITTQYGGPSSVANFQGNTAAKQAAALSADEIATGKASKAGQGQSGVASLLKDAYQQPNYTAGENNLDAFLAGGTTGGQQALSQAAAQGQGVTNAYSGIQDALGKAIQGGKDTAAATNKAYQDAINNATATSAATQAKYGSAVDATKKSSADAVARAQADAKAAQAELDRRAAAQAAAAEAAKAAAKAKADEEAKKQTEAQKIGGEVAGAVKTAGGQVAQGTKNAVGSVVSDLKGLPQNLVNAPSNIGRDVVGSVQGNQGSLNNLATDVLTGGLNKVAPTTTNNVVNTAKTIGGQVASVAKSVPKISKPKWAHGGEIQDPRKMACGGSVPYGGLIAKLRGKK